MSAIAEDEENKRVSMQVTSLSTQLIESIEKQSNLEHKLAQLERENARYKVQLHEKETLEKRNKILHVENQELMTRVNGLGERLEAEIKEKLAAQAQNQRHEAEISDLTEHLFGEADKMVSDARRETHSIQLRNDSLINQLREKDTVIGDLQSQLTVLKDLMYERDRGIDEAATSKRNSVIINSPRQFGDLNTTQQKQILYSPTLDAMRYDLKLFSEFRKFVKTIKDYDQIRDTDTKFIKKLLSDDIEPALRLDNAPGISWLNKRPTMSAIIDGRVSIEPVSGINETYRLNFQADKVQETDVKSNLYSYPAHSPPVAMEQACAVCGEARNDILEHSRLYIMKVYAKQDSTTTLNGPIAPIVAHQYPLCSYCLFRLRSVCELFAFLRSLKSDIWKLSNDNMVKKAWIEFARLRAKLFWAKIGIWDLENNVITTKITPSTEDAVYKEIAGTADPSSFSVYSSAESLLDPRTTDTNGYKSSPLVNQVNSSPQPAVTSSPQTPVKMVTAPESPDNDSIMSEATSQSMKTPPTAPTTRTEPPAERSEKSDGSDDDVGDIIGDYSHDEAAGDEDEAATEKVNPSGLLIHTDNENYRPQDDLFDSEQSTPVVGRNTSTLNTPVAAGGFDFEQQVTPTKVQHQRSVHLETETGEELKQELEEEKKEGEEGEQRDSSLTSDDETEFVDA